MDSHARTEGQRRFYVLRATEEPEYSRQHKSIPWFSTRQRRGGTRKRIKAAQAVLPSFGVATECGMGRTPNEELDSILQISEAVTKPVVCL